MEQLKVSVGRIQKQYLLPIFVFTFLLGRQINRSSVNCDEIRWFTIVFDAVRSVMR